MTTTVIPIVLNCKNYDDWSSRIMIYLLAKDLWDVIDQGHPKTEEESKVWKKKNAKALYAIQNSCGDDIYKLIKDIKRAKQVWDTLSNKFKPGEPSDEKPSDENPPDEKPPDEEGPNESDANDIHTPFDIYVKNHGWDNAINFLRQNRPLLKERLQFVRGGTALHFAIQNFKNCSVRNVEELVEIMGKDDLEIQDDDGLTALYHLIRDHPEEVEVAKRMVKKSDNLVTMLSSDKMPLVVLAQWRTEAERTARYLYSCTPHTTLNVRYAAQLVSNGFYYKKFDIAWDLIQRYPKLAIAKNYSEEFPLVELASNHYAFKNESQLSLLENLIYFGIRIKPLPFINDQSELLSDQKENQRHLISSGIFNRIYEMKLVHERVKQFLPLMCRSATMVSDEIRKSLDASLCVAAERGHVEYIKHLLTVRDSTHPVISVRNEKGQNLLQIAIECRHHKVYNVIISILGLSNKIQEGVWIDDFHNKILHTVASITPLSQIDHIQGAALKMQRELQWYEEVERIANSKDFNDVNKARKVFMENHKELRKEAEKSMKETATSCTVVGALIVTIMFAAAFTVPSGNGKNDEAAGLPTFLTNKVFTTYIVSDAISLFSSTTSVIMFLGILTSCYSEDDFYKFLPTKMIIGLFALFLSIATMMIVFSCGPYIMLDGKSSIVISSMLFATVPVISFIVMQFPLLFVLSSSTFGRGIFHRN